MHPNNISTHLLTDVENVAEKVKILVTGIDFSCKEPLPESSFLEFSNKASLRLRRSIDVQLTFANVSG